MTASPCFGIDLGTTCSSIGMVTEGIPKLIPLDGRDYLPSVVWFPREGAPVVGHPAVNQLPLDPSRTIRSAKRLMGTSHSYDLGDRSVTPVDVSAALLRAIADMTESSVGIRPKRVVITVPAWFDQAQRGETRLAAEQAGLELVRMINEPTAAALAHAHGHDIHRRALVYDLGGGTFDVSLVEQDGPVIEVRASRGDTHLGGDDIDDGLAALVLQRLSEGDPSLHEAILRSPAARVRLQQAVEQTKRELSESLKATLRIPFLLREAETDRHLEMSLDRADLDGIVEPLIERTLRCVEDVLRDADTRPEQIDDLLLVGGSTRLPQVFDALREAFGLEGSSAIPPRKAVALGAAIQAAIVDGSRVDGVLVDVAPWPLSVGHFEPSWLGLTQGRLLCHVLTPRNTPLPSRHSMRMSTVGPEQPEIRLPLFQGSNLDPRKNNILAEVYLSGLPPAPSGSTSRPIGVEIRHNLDGMVELIVTDELSGQSSRVRTAADGQTRADLWASFLERTAEEGLGLGPGGDSEEDDSEEDDSEEDDSEEALPERTEAALPRVTAPLSPDLTEALRSFESILAQEARLVKSNPKEVEQLLSLAKSGIEAISQDDNGAALSRYDDLSDRLFALGIYL